MVGHMHEDIDQMFSCFSRHLNKRDARTLPELVTEMAKAYTPEPANTIIDYMFDVKKWMDGHIEQQMSGHINQHQFKFILCNGKSQVFYKKWSTSQKWLPEDKGMTLVHSLPAGMPVIIPPSCEKIPVAKLKHDMGRLSSKFDKTTETWWEQFLNDLEKEPTQTKDTWFLEQLKKNGHKQPADNQDQDNDVRLSSEIEKLMEKECNETEVIYQVYTV